MRVGADVGVAAAEADDGYGGVGLVGIIKSAIFGWRLGGPFILACTVLEGAGVVDGAASVFDFRDTRALRTLAGFSSMVAGAPFVVVVVADEPLPLSVVLARALLFRVAFAGASGSSGSAIFLLIP